MAPLRSGLRRRHSTGAVQSHPMMHRTGAGAKLRRHLLLLHTRQAQFHRATPRPQRYGRLGNGIRIPGIVAQPPYPDTVWSDTPDAPPPASWTSVWRNTTPPPVHAPRDRTRQQPFRSVSKKTSAAPFVTIAATSGFNGIYTWGIVLVGVVGIAQTVHARQPIFRRET